MPPLLKSFVEPETACALAPLFGEHVQFLVEAVRNFFLEFIEMALVAPVKLGWLHRHAVSLISFLVGPSAWPAPYHAAVTIQAEGSCSLLFVIGGN